MLNWCQTWDLSEIFDFLIIRSQNLKNALNEMEIIYTAIISFAFSVETMLCWLLFIRMGTVTVWILKHTRRFVAKLIMIVNFFLIETNESMKWLWFEFVECCVDDICLKKKKQQLTNSSFSRLLRLAKNCNECCSIYHLIGLSKCWIYLENKNLSKFTESVCSTLSIKSSFH